MRRSLHAALFGLSLLVHGCAPQPETELLSLERITEDRLAEGGSLRILGRGFPREGEGTIRFEGETRRPGKPPLRVRAEAPVLVRSASEVEIPGDARLISRLGERGTFRGSLELRFSGDAGGVVFGAIPSLTLDVEPETRRSLAEAQQLTTAGLEFLSRLGVEPDPRRVASGGVRALAVTEGSAAARLGVQAGDVLLALDGVRARTVADLAPAPGREEHAFSVQPDGDGSPTQVVFPLHVASDALSPYVLGLSVMVLLLLLWLEFVAGTARVTAFLSREAPADGDGTLVWLFGASKGSGGAEERALRALLSVVGFAAMSLAFVGVAMIFRVLESGFGVGLFLSTSLLLRTVARFAGGQTVAFSVRMLPLLFVGAPLVLSIVAVSLLVGTGDLRLLHEAQGGMPWEWLVFRNPVAFALFPVFAATALGRVEAPGESAGFGPVAARAHLLVVSCLGAAVFLGGWNSPLPGAEASPLAGLLAYAVKCWLLIAMGLFARRVGPGKSEEVFRWALPLSLLCMLATGAYLLFGVPPVVERMSGPVLATAAALLFLYIALRRVMKRRPPLRLHPFL